MKNKISKVVAKKNGVEITIDEEKYFLNIDDYLNDYYYPGKELSQEEILILEKKSQNKKAKDYLLYLISYKRYTKKELEMRLKKKYNLKKEDLDQLILPLIENEIIQDKQYAIDYCESKIELGYGKNKIYDDLKRKGISKEILFELNPLFENERDVLPSLIEKMDHSKSSLTIEKRKEAITVSLIRRGYDIDTTRRYIEKYYSFFDEEKKMKEEEQRSVLLKKEAAKCYNSLSHKNWPNEKIKDSFIKKMMTKGFRYDEVQKIIKEYPIND